MEGLGTAYSYSICFVDWNREWKDWVLDATAYVEILGYIISFFSLLLSILILSYFRYTRTRKTLKNEDDC